MYKPLIKKGFLLLQYILLLTFVNAIEPDGSDAYGLRPFYVIHSPSYDLSTHNISTASDFKVGLRFEDVDAVYMLSNEHSPDSIIFTGLGLAGLRYYYALFDNDGTQVGQEMFYREAYNGETIYDIYGYKKTIKSDRWYTLPKIKDTFDGAEYATKYPDRLDRDLVHPSNEIPTFHIHADAEQLKNMMANVDDDELTVTASLTRIAAYGVSKFQDVEIKISGQTSKYFEKKSFSISLPTSGDSINGFRKFKLRSMVTDPSRLREKLYYDLLNAVGVPTARASYARVYVNDRPAGLYLLVDHYKSPFLENVFGVESSNNLWKRYSHGDHYYFPSEDVKGGNNEHGGLIHGAKKSHKSDGGANLECLGNKWEDYHKKGKKFYKIVEESDGRDVREAFVEFLEFIDGTKSDDLDSYFNKWFGGNRNEEQLVREWEQHLDVTVFLKNIALELILGGTDGYLGAAHNYFLYQDLSQNGRFVWLPSDLDLSQGSSLIPVRNHTSAFKSLDAYGITDTLGSRPLVNQVLKVPAFKRRFVDIIYDIYKNYFESGALALYIRFETSLIKDDASWDDYIWSDDTTDVEEEVNDQLIEAMGGLPLTSDFIQRLKSYVFHEGVFGVLTAHESILSIQQYYKLTQQNLYNFLTSFV